MCGKRLSSKYLSDLDVSNFLQLFNYWHDLDHTLLDYYLPTTYGSTRISKHQTHWYFQLAIM